MEGYDAAFVELKHRLITAPFLTIPDQSGDFISNSDAIGQGLDCAYAT